MQCPHFEPAAHAAGRAMCHSPVVPFEPMAISRAGFCTTDNHRFCPLYASSHADLPMAITLEVTRAIG